MYEFMDQTLQRGAASRARLQGHQPRTHSTGAATTLSVSKSSLIFPEIEYDKVDKEFSGMDIMFVTTARPVTEEAREPADS